MSVASPEPQVIPARFFTVDGAAAFTGLSSRSILTALRPVRGLVLVDRVELEQLISTSTGKLRKSRGHAVRGGSRG